MREDRVGYKYECNRKRGGYSVQLISAFGLGQGKYSWLGAYTALTFLCSQF